MSEKSKTPEGLKAFTHLGIIDRQDAQDATGPNHNIDCPFCGATSLGIALEEKQKDDGSTVSPGMWRCFKCSESGNTISLLQKIYDLCKGEAGNLKTLSDDRGLPESLLREYGIIQAPYTINQYWVPVFNFDGNVVNIYRYDLKLKAEKSKFAFIGTPGCQAGLFNIQTFKTPPPGNKLDPDELESARLDYPIYCLEGHWDTIAWDFMLREGGERSQADVCGIPGAGSFQQGWFRYMDGRPLVLMNDYDPPQEVNGKTVQPGWDGIQRTIKLAKRCRDYKPSSIRILEWKA